VSWRRSQAVCWGRLWILRLHVCRPWHPWIRWVCLNDVFIHLSHLLVLNFFSEDTDMQSVHKSKLLLCSLLIIILLAASMNIHIISNWC
jgi:hypothetical protein